MARPSRARCVTFLLVLLTIPYNRLEAQTLNASWGHTPVSRQRTEDLTRQLDLDPTEDGEQEPPKRRLFDQSRVRLPVF